MPLTFNTPEWRAARDEMLDEYVIDQHAVLFLHSIFGIAEVWDDLIDRDKPVSDTDINHAFMTALIGLNTNPFFRAHTDALLALMVTGINCWMDANRLETGDANDRAVAYVLRDWYCEVAAFCVFVLHGFSRMQDFSLAFRRFHMAHESVEQFSGGQP